MLQRMFLTHPRSVGETYVEHLATASGFAAELAGAAFCCAVHAVVPALFERNASRAIDRLHARMVCNRGRAQLDAQRPAQSSAKSSTQRQVA